MNVQLSPVPELELTVVFRVMVVSKHVSGSTESIMDDDGGSLKWLVALATQEGIRPITHSLLLWYKSGRRLHEMLK